MNTSNKSAQLVVLVAGLAILLAGSVAGAWPQAQLEPAARAFVAEMVAGKFDNAAARFDETMAKVMPAAKLAETWNTVLAQVGEYREITGAQQTETQGYQVVLLTTRFEKTSLFVRVVFDGQGRIGGLFFAPVQPPAVPWALPEYAHPHSFIERPVTVGMAPWELPGILTLPKGEGKFPAVVLVHGSGALDPDETIGPNKPFKDLAWGLASRGVAVLRYEKRNHKYAQGFAAMPNLTVRQETTEDAERAVDLLAAQPEIDPARIYVLGHSLGGMLAPRIAAAKKNLAGVIALAGNTRPIEVLIPEQVRFQAELDGQITDAEKARIEAVDAAVRQAVSPDLQPGDVVRMAGIAFPGSYLLDLRGYSPARVAADLPLRILVLWGEQDIQVRAADFDGWKKALAGKSNAVCKSYAGLSHLMTAVSSNSPAEYNKPGHVSAEVVSDIAAWILQQKN